MPIILKSQSEIESMRRTGRIGYEILHKLVPLCRPGTTTEEIHQMCRVELENAGARGMSKNYPTYKEGEGYPAHMCISVNEEVVHGIPGKRALKEGDLVSLDLGLMFEGFCGDTAITVPVGKILPAAQKLLDITQQTLELAIRHIRPGKKWSEVARVMQHHVESNGFGVVREFVGHGVGRVMHEDLKVPNYVSSDMRGDFRMRPGMTFAVEPMVVAGKRDVVLLQDEWTVVTVDRKLAAHFEHTVAVTEGGCDVLTDGRAVAGEKAAV